MGSNIQIANQALSLLGANTIADFYEGSNEANIIKTFYDTAIRDAFSRYAWSFATKKVQLERYNNSSGDAIVPLNEYDYQYIRPIDALHIFTVFRGTLDTRSVDFDLQEDLILSNFDNPLYAEYTVYKSENLWPGYFIKFFTHALAGHIAIPVTDSPEMSDKYMTLAYGSLSSVGKGGLFAMAVGADSRQKPAERIASNPLGICRFSGRGSFRGYA